MGYAARMLPQFPLVLASCGFKHGDQPAVVGGVAALPGIVHAFVGANARDFWSTIGLLCVQAGKWLTLSDESGFDTDVGLQLWCQVGTGL